MTSPRRSLLAPSAPVLVRPARVLARPLRVLAPVVVAVVALAGCGGSGDAETPSSADGGRCDYPASSDSPSAEQVEAPPEDPPADPASQVTIATDRGDVRVSLAADEAPCTVSSFLSLAEQGYFDGTPCHRLTSGGLNVLQCGDPTGTGTGGPGYSFADELQPDDPRLQPCLGQVDPSTGAEVCTYPAGTVAMANSGPDSNGSQFFLVYADSPLPAAYTVFGRMSAAGVSVVKDVAARGIAADGTSPRQPVTIESVE